MGVTYSDIRLALLIEARFQDRYAADLPRYQRPVWLPKSWSQFVGHQSKRYKLGPPRVASRPGLKPPIPPLPFDDTGYLDDDILLNHIQPIYNRSWSVSHRFRVFLVPQTAYEIKYRHTRLRKQFALPGLEALHRFTDKVMDLDLPMKKTVRNFPPQNVPSQNTKTPKNALGFRRH